METTTMNRINAWFSCGAASAVAWMLATKMYANRGPVAAFYCDLSHDEHPDNPRFLADVERWVGARVTTLRNPKFRTVEEVWIDQRFIVGFGGASCSRHMKRRVREAHAQPGDITVMGYTADERDRANDFDSSHPDTPTLYPLIERAITKEDCYHILSSQNIELPAMQRLGYNNNNCRGCCHGGKGYWNKIRIDFPEIFNRRARVQRQLQIPFRSGGKPFYLDELAPDEGRDVPEPPIDCGVMCHQYSQLIQIETHP
jgi:hypothetical protein